MCSQYEPPTYDNYTYPWIAKVFGNILAVIPLIPLPVSIVYEISRAKGTLSEVWFIFFSLHTVKVLHFRTPKKFAVITLKFKQRGVSIENFFQKGLH